MANGSKPDYAVYVTRERENDKPFYTRVGSAWKVAKDGISIALEAVPVDGKLVMFPPKED